MMPKSLFFLSWVFTEDNVEVDKELVWCKSVIQWVNFLNFIYTCSRISNLLARFRIVFIHM